MLRWNLCLAAAALALAAYGPSSAAPSAPSSDDPSHWDASQRASFNDTFAKTTHDSCLRSAQSHGASADAAEHYCACVVGRLAPLSVEDKIALPQHQDTLVAASNACKTS
ncbi:MAG TPA: hypothetical protein VN814_03560 [Caulobacteraceae bacterium]|nr:hypothetical protein [Caulobacteraceae bacterium]